MIDDRLTLKIPKERGDIVLNRVKALIVKEYGKLHGNYAEVILNMIEFSCDIIDKDPKAMLFAHTQQPQNVKKRQIMIDVFRFIEKWTSYFEEKARLYDDLYSKAEAHFGLTDPRALKPKILEICNRLNLGILKLHDGHQIIITKYSSAYIHLEKYDIKYKGKRHEPSSINEKAAYSAIMRNILSPNKKPIEKITLPETDEGLSFLGGLKNEH